MTPLSAAGASMTKRALGDPFASSVVPPFTYRPGIEVDKPLRLDLRGELTELRKSDPRWCPGV